MFEKGHPYYPHKTYNRKGYIWWDGAIKDYRGKLRQARYHNCWRAAIMVHGKSYRKRSTNRHDLEFWLELMVERFKDE